MTIAVTRNYIYITFNSFKIFPDTLPPCDSVLITICKVGRANFILTVLRLRKVRDRGVFPQLQ